MIRELRVCDVAACVEIARDNWGDGVADKLKKEMRHAFLTEMEWPPHYYVYEHNQQVVGFGGMISSWIMTDVWDFIWINIRKDYIRQDIGSQLTRYRIEEVRRMGGKAIQLMTQKPGFFKRFGFRALHVYQTREPSDKLWVLMNLELGDLDLK